MEVAAVQIPAIDLLNIGTEKSSASFKPFFIDLGKGFEIVLHTPGIIGRLQALGIDGIFYGFSGTQSLPLSNTGQPGFKVRKADAG